MKTLLYLSLTIISWTYSLSGKSQSQEIQQLLLNIQKLEQLKSILAQMKQGYSVISGGYERIKGLTKGNFDLHKDFLDKLLQVSPTVRNYYKVGQIINIQRSILSQCSRLRFISQNSQSFAPAEQRYLSGVQENLLQATLKQLEALAMLLTNSQLRMSDGERLAGIDQVYRTVQDQLAFIQTFNSRSTLLRAGRAAEQVDIKSARRLHRVTP
jgi:hypothetical protein